jgi:hypothetical protein
MLNTIKIPFKTFFSNNYLHLFLIFFFLLQLPNNKICTKPFRQEDVYISRMYVIQEANLLVVAYLLRKHCEIEGEVYVYKNVLQLWSLARLELVYV